MKWYGCFMHGKITNYWYVSKQPILCMIYILHFVEILRMCVCVNNTIYLIYIIFKTLVN